jgi:hypothetical protein
MHAPKTHAHPATKNSTGSIRIAISFALMFRFQHKPAFSTAKLAQNAADLAQTIDLVEGIRPPLGGQWRSPLDDDNGGAGSFAIDRAGEIRLTVEQRTGRTPHRPALVLPVASISMCQLWFTPDK